MKKPPFGKVVKEFRLSLDMTQGDVAEHLGCKVSFYSAIEVGRKTAPVGFIDQLSDLFALDASQRADFFSCAARSIDQVRINTAAANDEAREVALRFARSFEGLGADKLDKIKGILDD